MAVLQPLDIYTNAGAAGDIVGAFRMLPGNQKVGEQTGLFVRGGDAGESSVIIDGMVVQNPFFSDVPGVSQRSRFSPFDFKGMSFSSGGYGARYGQALSSILELNTNDLPDKDNLNLSVNMSGLEGSADKRFEKTGGEITAAYTNLSPFFSIANTNYKYYKVPQGGSFSAKWGYKSDKDMFKIFAKNDFTSSGSDIPDPYNPGSVIPFGLNNTNTYFNTSYVHRFTGWYVNTAASASFNHDNITWDTIMAQNRDWRIQWRGEAVYHPSEKLNIIAGTELQRYGFKRIYDTLQLPFDEFLISGYMEGEWKPLSSFAIKPGIRFEHSTLLNASALEPRLAMALKVSASGQISMAWGMYYQDPDKKYLCMGYKPGFEQAIHYIANYQWSRDDHTLRIEGYYKSYNDLVKELDNPYNPNPYRFIYGPVNNSGNGYARGLDLFWRDKKSLKNLDYWISYSYIDSKRLYENFPVSATPDFVSTNNLSFLARYFVDAWQTNFGFTYIIPAAGLITTLPQQFF